MFEVLSMRYATEHPSDFRMARKLGVAEYLLLYFKSKAGLLIGTDEYSVEPNTMVLLDRCTPYEIWAVSEGIYVDGHIQFDTSREIPRDILNHPIPIGDSFKADQYLMLLSDSLYLGRRNDFVAEELTYIIVENLYDLVKHPERQSRYFDDFSKLRMELYSNPQLKWTVKEMSSSLHLSPSHFLDLYKTFFGSTPISDVISGKIKAAKMLLYEGALSINEIATVCGYKNTVHFSRQFKQHTGMSPSQFKKHGVKLISE